MTAQWICRLAVLVCLGAACGLAQTSAPDTPAGHTLQAWLNAFNSDDRAKVEAYVKTVDNSENVDGMMSFRGQTGGFELIGIESSEPLHLRFRVKEKGGETTALGNLLVKDGQPPTVETFGLRALPPGVVPVNVIVDAALRKRVIEGVNADLNEFYIDAALAKQMGDVELAHEKSGDYDKMSDGDAFAGQLTKDLQAVSHDKHLRVDFNPFKMPRMGSQLRKMKPGFIIRWNTTIAP